MADNIRIAWNEQAIAELAHSPEFRALVTEIGEKVARGAASAAPRLTGAGARSIRSDLVEDPRTGWEAGVDWDRDHHYLNFHEFGTRYLPARPFMQPAFDRYARL